MQARIAREVLFSDVGEDFRMTLPTILRLFQDIAARHSEDTGWGIPRLREEGIVWVLHKLALEIERYPAYGQTFEIRSWSRGAQGVNMLRDFRIYADGELAVSGSSRWFFFDRRQRRVSRVPAELDEAYQAEGDEVALDPRVLADWTPYDRFEPAHVHTVRTRRSDADASRHVNNARFCEYVLDALEAQGRRPQDVRFLRFLFAYEIDPDAGEVTVGLADAEQGAAGSADQRFSIHVGETLHARGDLRFARDNDDAGR